MTVVQWFSCNFEVVVGGCKCCLYLLCHFDQKQREKNLKTIGKILVILILKKGSQIFKRHTGRVLKMG